MLEKKYRAWDWKQMIYDISPWQHDFVVSTSTWVCKESADSEWMALMEMPVYRFKEIMDFVGVDIDWNDIYDWDICELYIKWNNFIVEWSEYEQFAAHDWDWWTIPFYNFNKLRIIGNKYENIELLPKYE